MQKQQNVKHGEYKDQTWVVAVNKTSRASKQNLMNIITRHKGLYRPLI